MRVATRWASSTLLALLIVSTLAACQSRSGTAGTPAGGQLSNSASSATPSSSASTSPATGIANSTRMVRFRAFTATGRLTTPVRGSGSGSCFTTSITVPVARSYRCFESNQIFDPCFASPAQLEPNAVVCYADPWSAGRRIKLSKPLPDISPIGHPRPWAIQLANGARCLSVTGTVQIDHGVPLAYQCANGRGAGLTRDHGRLLVAAYGLPPDGALRRLAVTTAWTG